MEFWGVEVKSGESLKVDPGDDKIVHLSMACLGEVNKDKGSEPVSLYVKFGNQRLVLGTLSSEKFPQISYDLIFEKEFELSHNWKNGSVFFTGFKAESQLVSDDDEDSDDYDGEDIPVSAAANGKPESEVKNAAKSGVSEAKQKEKIADPKKNKKYNEKDANGEDDEEDSSEADSDEDSSEDELMLNGQIESSEDDDDSDDDDNNNEDDEDSDDEETPKTKKAEGSNKRRVPESSKKTPVPVKKAKFVTPEKTGGKNSGHVATPYPSKQAGKAPANDKQPVKQQTPKSGGDYSCKPCNRSFKTEDALNSHNRAKHSAK